MLTPAEKYVAVATLARDIPTAVWGLVPTASPLQLLNTFGGSGIAATLRDYGRFGLFFLHGGVIGRDTILPTGWLSEAGSAKTLTTGKRQQYGYMWWPVESATGTINEGAFSAEGIFGQWMYINPKHQVVIVQWGAQTQPSGGDVVNPEACFGAITAQLRR